MNSPKKTDFDIKDIIAMVIAAFQLILPPVFIMFGVIMSIYFLLRLFLKI